MPGIKAFYCDPSDYKSVVPRFYRFVGRGGGMADITLFQMWVLGRQFSVFLKTK